MVWKLFDLYEDVSRYVNGKSTVIRGGSFIEAYHSTFFEGYKDIESTKDEVNYDYVLLLSSCI